jgi:VanZ family protein
MKVLRTLLFWLPAVFWAGLAFYLSAQSKLPDVTPRFHGSDKILHFIFYLIFSFLVLLPLRYGHRFTLVKAIILAFVITSAYGATDEFHQSFVPNRTCDITDWIADTFGGFIAASAYWIYETRRSQKAYR